jgi:hypothetical protein
MADPQPPKDLLPVLSAIAAWFHANHSDYAIIGGVAIGLIAEPRLTQDVDAVAWIDLDDAAVFLKSGEQFGFFARISKPLDFLRKSRVLLLRHRETQINVDISCGILPFEREMIDRAIEFKTKDISLKVASPEDLVITKAVAHRQRDLIDIDKLLEIYPNLDFSRVRFWVTEFAKVLETPELLNDLEALLKNRSK